MIKNLFSGIVERLYLRWFPRGLFYTPERSLSDDQVYNLSLACKRLLMDDDLILLRDIFVSMSEHRQLRDAGNFKFKVTEAELERKSREGVERFFDLIQKASQSKTKSEFDKHSII